MEAALPSYEDAAVGVKSTTAGADGEPPPGSAAAGPMQLGHIDRSMTRPRGQGSVELSADSLLRRVRVSTD